MTEIGVSMENVSKTDADRMYPRPVDRPECGHLDWPHCLHLPSRDQIAIALHGEGMTHPWNDERWCPHFKCLRTYRHRADAVMALLIGEARDE